MKPAPSLPLVVNSFTPNSMPFSTRAISLPITPPTARPSTTWKTFSSRKGVNFSKPPFKNNCKNASYAPNRPLKPSSAPTVKKTRYQDEKSKHLISVHGDVVLDRCCRYCRHCEQYSFPIERILGLPTRYSTALKCFTARCCGFWSYALSAQNLKALCGIHLSPTTVGEIADAVAGDIAETLPDNIAIRERFQKAQGETEFTLIAGRSFADRKAVMPKNRLTVTA